MSLTLRAGGLRAGLPEGEYGIGATAVGSNSNTRGRCRFPTASFGSRSSASAPPRLLRGSSVDPSKRHRRVLSESPRPNARRPCSAANAFGKPSTFYGHGAPAGSRRSNSCCKGKAAVAQHASSGRTGMLQNPALYGGSAAFLGRAATKGGSSVSLAVNSLLSPAFVSTAEETGLIAARHNGDVQTQAPASSLDLAGDEERPTLNVQRIKQEAYTGTVRVRLTVQHPSAAEGVQLKAVGNRRALGSWNPGMAADFENRGDGSWSLDVTVPPGLLRFKLVLQSADGLVLAEKGIRRTEVPSARLAQSMPACYFNISCAWGVAGDPTVQAIRLPETARQHQIRSAEEQVVRLRERQAKLQARMTCRSSRSPPSTLLHPAHECCEIFIWKRCAPTRVMPAPGKDGGEQRVLGLDDLDVIAKRLMSEVSVKNRTWLFRSYERCFLGVDLVKAMIALKIAPDAKGAVQVGNQLMARRVFHHVWETGFDFKNSTLFYRFSFHEQLLGGADLTNISHTYVLKTCERMKGQVEMVEYKDGHHAFTGRAGVEWLMKEGTVLTEAEATQLCNLFVACRLIAPVVSKTPLAPFSDSVLYRLVSAGTTGNTKEAAKTSLGVLRLEYGYPPIPGDIDHPNSFPYSVVYRQVPGLTFELAQSGGLPDDVRAAFLNAIRDLEKLGVFGITGDCGFMANYQRFVADSTTACPVFMSSLCLIPSIMAGMKTDAKLVVVTANSESLSVLFPNRFDAPLPESEHHRCAATNKFLSQQMGCTVARPECIVNMGLQDVIGFDVVAAATSLLSPEVDRVLVGQEIAKRVVDFIGSDTAVQAILLECTELPHFSAPMLRHYTQLPVFDALSVCDFFQAATDYGPEQTTRRAHCVGQHCQRGLPDTLVSL